MNDVKQLLEVAATLPRSSVDPADDLRRARASSRARTGRRLRLGSAGLALAAVVAVGLGEVATDPGPSGPGPSASPEAFADVRLVAGELDADPYTFAMVPQGWSVQSQNPYAVTIAPDDGTTSASPDDFRGKLVILFDQNPPNGDYVSNDGRDFWISVSSDYVTVATVTRGDEPPGVVRIQYPADAGWSHASMLEFLGSVHVGPGALPGQG